MERWAVFRIEPVLNTRLDKACAFLEAALFFVRFKMSHCEHCGFTTGHAIDEANNLLLALGALSNLISKNPLDSDGLYWLLNNLTIPLKEAIKSEDREAVAKGGGT